MSTATRQELATNSNAAQGELLPRQASMNAFTFGEPTPVLDSRGILDYDRRHGYRGAESYADPGRLNTQHTESMDEILSEIPDYDDMLAAIVTQAGGGSVTVYRYGESIRISGDGLRFASSMLGDKAPPNKRLKRGAIIRLYKDDKGIWQISQHSPHHAPVTP